MLKVHGLTKQFAGQVLFEDSSFIMGQGEKVGLVGRNGSGKSTLLKLIRGLESPDAGDITMPRHYTIGSLDQHISFSKNSVLEECEASLSGEEIYDTYKVKKILMGLGIAEEDFHRPPQSFSGGQQIRINLAKCLLTNPSLLLLDEPTNYLDIVSMRWLKKFLKEYPGEVILITHDRQFMDDVVTHVMGISRQRFKKFQGNTEHFYKRLMEEEVLHEKTRQNLEAKKKELMAFVTRFKAKASKAAQAQSRMKQLEKMGTMEELKKEKELNFSFNYDQCRADVLMNAVDLSFSWSGKGEETLFKNFSLSIGPKDRIAIVGKNGKGKSTLLNVLASELKSLSGNIYSHPDLKLGFFGQTNIQRLDFDNTIIEEVKSVDPSCSDQKVRTVCATMMFEGEMAKKKISVLSGGEKARVMLAKILAKPTNLLMLDEPTNHLDMFSMVSLCNEIDDYPGALVVVTHNEELLHAFAQKLIVFKENGAEIFLGSYQDFLDREGWDEDEGGKVKETAKKKSFADVKKSPSDEEKKLFNLKKIEQLENEIIEHEEILKQIDEKLIAAYEKNDKEKIDQFAPLSAKLKEKIDNLYAQLEAVTLN